MATYSLLFGHADWPADGSPDECPPELERRAERLTVRLPAPVRRRIETSAAREGLSADEWAALALARALDGPTAAAR